MEKETKQTGMLKRVGSEYLRKSIRDRFLNMKKKSDQNQLWDSTAPFDFDFSKFVKGDEICVLPNQDSMITGKFMFDSILQRGFSFVELKEVDGGWTCGIYHTAGIRSINDDVVQERLTRSPPAAEENRSLPDAVVPGVATRPHPEPSLEVDEDSPPTRKRKRPARRKKKPSLFSSTIYSTGVPRDQLGDEGGETESDVEDGIGGEGLVEEGESSPGENGTGDEEVLTEVIPPECDG